MRHSVGLRSVDFELKACFSEDQLALDFVVEHVYVDSISYCPVFLFFDGLITCLEKRGWQERRRKLQSYLLGLLLNFRLRLSLLFFHFALNSLLGAQHENLAELIFVRNFQDLRLIDRWDLPNLGR